MVSRDLFISILDSLHNQYLFDKKYSDGICLLFGCVDVPMYDNSKLLDCLFLLMCGVNPLVHSLVFDYCYVMNFGLDSEYSDHGVFYDYLVGLIDE